VAVALSGVGLIRAEAPQGPKLLVNGYRFDRGAGEFTAGKRAAWARRGGSRYQLVQLVGPVRPEWKTALASAGARLVDYVPDYTFLAHVPPARLAAVKARSSLS
jgi:hypothetical protein